MDRPVFSPSARIDALDEPPDSRPDPIKDAQKGNG